MEMSHGNSCIAILNNQKCYLFIYKIKVKEGRTGGGNNVRGEEGIGG
jgi:hypothetical protein